VQREQKGGGLDRLLNLQDTSLSTTARDSLHYKVVSGVQAEAIIEE